jgi:chromosomal replication initiator protein
VEPPPIIKMQQIWEKAQHIIKEKVGEQFYELWFRPVELSGVKDGQAVLDIPNRFFKDWIEDNYPGLVGEALRLVTNSELKIKYRIVEKQDPAAKKIDNLMETRRARLASKGLYLNPKYTFEHFVPGGGNKLAKAAAERVAEAPGKSFNPLFVYGGVGFGKTHLISSIGNRVVDHLRNFNVLYVSSEQFTNEVVHAVRHGKTDQLKAKYRSLDLLLMDDVQFIENKTATQEELFHTLNTLYESQKQIVLSSDRPPKEIKNLTDRLRSRFGMGLTVEIEPADFETKKAIIQQKAAFERITLPDEVQDFLARRIKSNIRELEGCLIRLAAHSSLTGSPIDLSMAKTVLKDIISDDDKPLTVECILKGVAEHYGMKPLDMKARKRSKDIAIPRQVAMYIARELTGASLSEIGKVMGGKDHATVIYACKQVIDKRSKDENFNRMIDSLVNKLKP